MGVSENIVQQMSARAELGSVVIRLCLFRDSLTKNSLHLFFCCRYRAIGRTACPLEFELTPPPHVTRARRAGTHLLQQHQRLAAVVTSTKNGPRKYKLAACMRLDLTCSTSELTLRIHLFRDVNLQSSYYYNYEPGWLTHLCHVQCEKVRTFRAWRLTGGEQPRQWRRHTRSSDCKLTFRHWQLHGPDAFLTDSKAQRLSENYPSFIRP
jgi:hypothetical protein